MPCAPLLQLWARLVCFASVTVILAVTIAALISIDGWLMYERGWDIATELGSRLTIAVGLGITVGTAATLLALPYVLWRRADTSERALRVARIASIIMVSIACSGVLGVLLRWTMAVGVLNLTNRAYIVLWGCLSGASMVGCFIWYVAPPRRTISTSLLIEKFSGRATRRLLLFAGIGGLIAAFSDEMVPRISRRSVRSTAKPSAPNVVLVTFDALCAEDMSTYGYHLPTTPNIDALAQTSFGFSSYFGTSTFTTPCIASMLTGRYPSSTRVYHYGGRLNGPDAERTLPGVLRANGYMTAASVANPGAHPDCLGFGSDFDILPAPPIRDLPESQAVTRFHSAALATDAAFGGRMAPYLLEQLAPHVFGQTHSVFPPKMSFDQAEIILDELQGPFFLWVHTYAPHFPYLPEPPFLKKFLPGNELRTHTEFANLFDLKGYNYSAVRQPLIEKARLRYDEWTAQADNAFGQFMAVLKSSGHFDRTAVVVSSDHGESFQGGYVGHGGPRQLRPILHVPLVVHLPGQSTGMTLNTVADHSRLAPTILEIAGIERPAWMDGTSLCGVMRGEGGAPVQLAFTQYFEENSAFKPIRHGTVGVIDGQHQYVVDLDTKMGALYSLAEAQNQGIDLSSAQPLVASRLRDEIGKRFPQLLAG